MNNQELINLIEVLTGLKYKYNSETFKGGDVLEPTCRYSSNVYVVDYKRFYPHIIVMWNLFDGRLNKFIEELLHKSIHLEGKDKLESKFLLNRMYGMLKHFDIKEAEKVTAKGREVIQETRDLLEFIGYKILNSDTDSVTIKDTYNNPRKLFDYLAVITKQINESSENPQDTFELSIENIFKYIYFFPKEKAIGFKKKQYLGARVNGEIVLKSKVLNLDEELAWSFIATQLRQGKYQVNIDEFINFAMKIKRENDIFINPDNISIIELVKPTVKL